MKVELINLQKNIVVNLKLLVYKENSCLVNKINFKVDDIFLEPLLFIYFNTKKDDSFSKEILTEILQGYYTEKENLKIKHSFNKDNIAYIPNIGYFAKNEDQPFENIKFIPNTKIELILYPVIHTKSIFKDFKNQIIEESEIEISKSLCESYIEKLSNALQLIKTNCFDHYQQIEQCCKKIILFKTNPKNTNSFATINAHGIAFLNVCQDDYDEVFFVDDIAHQTGHIIMTTILFERKKYFKINENENIGSIINQESEYRSLYVLFHALYTYYTTLLCLDKCSTNNCFDKTQTYEAIARIGFYLIKYRNDLIKFEQVVSHYTIIDNVLTNDGINIFKLIKDKYIEMHTKWYDIIFKFNYKNQPYNFTLKDFLIQNPYKNA